MEGRSPYALTLTTNLNENPRRSVPTDASQSVHSTKTNPVFPLELFEHITARLIIFSPPQDATNGSLCSQKSSWSDVSGFMAASVLLHNIAMARWMRVLTIRSSEDWEKVLKQPHLVRELTCLDCVIGSGIGQSILTRFPNLHTVSINAHSDVYRNQSGRFSYRDVFNSLPASLLRLEVTCAHGPDLKVIETVRRYCPNIETLRLGRCTMFNRTPACEFWSGFPFDHDAYIAADGTDDYAHSVAQEVSSLKCLENLRLGVYLVPSTTVLAHRAYHTRKQPAPAEIDWQQALADLSNSNIEPVQPPEVSQLISLYHQDPEAEFGPETCTFCHDAYFEGAKDAERSASAIMKQIIPSLETVEWMDWFTPSHHGVSRCYVGSLPDG